MDLKLGGQVALVTGASGALGGAIAAALAEEGMRLVLVGSDKARLEAVGRDVRAGAWPVSADLTEPGAADACVTAALAAAGRLDLLINCAGATRRGDFFDLTEADWTAGFALKFHGCVRMCRAAWPHLVASHGAVINIVGVGSRTPSADFLIGGSVNSALLNFTKGLAERGMAEGVRVNAVNPGFFATERTEKRIRGLMDMKGLSRAEAAAEVLRAIGVQRFGQPREVAELVAWLASDRAAYVQGATFDIDGGASRGL